MKRLLVCVVLLAASVAQAKLPVAEMTEEAKAKAADAAAKAAHGNKVVAFQLCRAQDRAASSYFKTAASSGKAVKPAATAPACADPGPFVAPVSTVAPKS